ncbi:MAG: 3-isopropylmalate dehydratase large subunit [Anaerolineae bacterium]|nr:3-isopropylmalate dehydratase large subunit [Anaerolineae bacterium]
MGKTLAEKIIAAHAEQDSVSAGDLVTVNVDVVMANDITAPIAINSFDAVGVEEVFNPDRIMLVPSHFTPNKDIKSAEQARTLARFAESQMLSHRFQVGRSGIEHVILPERGLVLPGDLVVGGDSHTCTYGALGAFATGMGSTDIAVTMATGQTWLRVPETMKFVYHGQRQQWVYGKDMILRTIGEISVDGALYRAMEFTGQGITGLGMSDRLTMANMIIEAGGKCGFMPFDAVTQEYVEARATRSYTPYAADDDADYVSVHEFDLSDMEPQVACPYSPDNVKPVSQVEPEKVDQVFIGSCTNGRFEDFAIVADILEKTGREFHPDVRVMIIPGSQAVYLDVLRQGWIELFTLAGGAVSTSTCGPCLGGHMGVLASEEVCVSTSNRNFRGRMGHRDARVFLANPAIATASAILGRIGHPDEL